jgi:hypothetical protein
VTWRLSVWLESSTPLLSNCVICRASVGVGKRSFHRFLLTKILTSNYLTLRD